MGTASAAHLTHLPDRMVSARHNRTAPHATLPDQDHQHSMPGTNSQDGDPSSIRWDDTQPDEHHHISTNSRDGDRQHGSSQSITQNRHRRRGTSRTNQQAAHTSGRQRGQQDLSSLTPSRAKEQEKNYLRKIQPLRQLPTALAQVSTTGHSLKQPNSLLFHYSLLATR